MSRLADLFGSSIQIIEPLGAVVVAVTLAFALALHVDAAGAEQLHFAIFSKVVDHLARGGH